MDFEKILFSAIVIIALIIAGCTQPEKKETAETGIAWTGKDIPDATNGITPTSAPIQQTVPLRGFSLSPKSYEAADFTGFFEKAAEMLDKTQTKTQDSKPGTIVSWAGDWNELDGEKGGPTVVTELSKQYGYVPLVEAQFFTQATGKLLRPLDESTKGTYKDGVVAFAKKYKPEYFAVGIEINILYEKSPADFEKFVGFYAEVYDAVKAVSPDTKVFTIFQLEKMKGLGGGLFGGTNDEKNAQWQLLDKFKKNDIAAFTTYPGLIYTKPSEIPADYYSELKSRTNGKPIAFTEIGWHSAASPQGWESSEAEQAEFVKIFFSRTDWLGSEFSIWSFLYDQKTFEPFNSMGFYGADGSEKVAWKEWINAE